MGHRYSILSSPGLLNKVSRHDNPIGRSIPADAAIYSHRKFTFPLTPINTGITMKYARRNNLVLGEAYKIKLLQKEKIIHMEENRYGAKALIAHSRLNNYDGELQVVYPTIEEFMYFYAGRKNG